MGAGRGAVARHRAGEAAVREDCAVEEGGEEGLLLLRGGRGERRVAAPGLRAQCACVELARLGAPRSGAAVSQGRASRRVRLRLAPRDVPNRLARHRALQGGTRAGPELQPRKSVRATKKQDTRARAAPKRAHRVFDDAGLFADGGRLGLLVQAPPLGLLPECLCSLQPLRRGPSVYQRRAAPGCGAAPSEAGGLACLIVPPCARARWCQALPPREATPQRRAPAAAARAGAAQAARAAFRAGQAGGLGWAAPWHRCAQRHKRSEKLAALRSRRDRSAQELTTTNQLSRFETMMGPGSGIGDLSVGGLRPKL